MERQSEGVQVMSASDSENTEETDSASTAAPVPAETWTQEVTPASAATALPEGTPFRDDQLLFYEGALIRNELADAQADPEAARDLAARHWSRLLYDPNLPWRGRAPYPQVSPPKPGKQTP
jgi:hypothetical protein